MNPGERPIFGEVLGAVVVGWATMTAALAAIVSCTNGKLSFGEAIAWGSVAIIPSGIGGGISGSIARTRRSATWPIAVAPGCLIAIAAGLTAASYLLGRMPWDDEKTGPLLIAGLLVFASGPTFLAGVWARWSIARDK